MASYSTKARSSELLETKNKLQFILGSDNIMSGCLSLFHWIVVIYNSTRHKTTERSSCRDSRGLKIEPENLVPFLDHCSVLFSSKVVDELMIFDTNR